VGSAFTRQRENLDRELAEKNKPSRLYPSQFFIALGAERWASDTAWVAHFSASGPPIVRRVPASAKQNNAFT
jgi:hypothetical protein